MVASTPRRWGLTASSSTRSWRLTTYSATLPRRTPSKWCFPPTEARPGRSGAGRRHPAPSFGALDRKFAHVSQAASPAARLSARRAWCWLRPVISFQAPRRIERGGATVAGSAPTAPAPSEGCVVQEILVVISGAKLLLAGHGAQQACDALTAGQAGMYNVSLRDPISWR